jgi:hypothetical protein
MGKLTPKQIIGKVNNLKGRRGVWETHWKDLAFFFQPNRREILEELAKGSKQRNVNLLDNTGIQSVELLSAGLHSMLTNPNLLWFELTTGDEKFDDQDGVRQWLQETSLALLNVINNSNFNTEIHQLYLDVATFGTGGMLIEEDKDKVVRFSTKHIIDFLIEENHHGFIDRIYRRWEWSAENIVAEFGEENVGKKVLDAYQKNSVEEKFKVIHAVYPRDVFSGASDKLKPFVSQYILDEDEGFLLREGGYREFPYVVPRWTKSAAEMYGRSPAMVGLSDMKTLNVMTQTMIVASQKVADPPLQMPDDGYVLPIITRPGGINYKRPGADRIEPLFNQIPVDFGSAALEDRRQRIRAAFFVDQLQLQSGPQMTATEVLQRTEEKNRLLGPVLGRMQSEFLVPMITRVFDIAQRKNLIQEPPPALEGVEDLDVRYSSMIARAQRVSEAQNVLRTVETVSPFIQLDASVADVFDGDEIARVIARSLNFPQRGMRNNKEIEALREQRAKAQQEAIENERANQEADRISKVAPAAAIAGQ